MSEAEILETRKSLRDLHNLDISISPTYMKENVDPKKPNIQRSAHVRKYTYAILLFEWDGHSVIDNGHKPWPVYDTYEKAQENAVEVCLAYLTKK